MFLKITICVVLSVVHGHSNTPPFPQGQQQPHQHQAPQGGQFQQNQQQFQQNQQVQQNQQQFQQNQQQFQQPGQQAQQLDGNQNLHFQSGQAQAHGATGTGRFHDKNHIMDKDHLSEHLDGVINKPEDLSPDEMQFHYFKVHDYDNNNMLDGIELTAALTHFHKEEAELSEEERLSDGEIAELIDEIMKEDDLNDDGYIDYAEFISSQQRSEVQDNV